VWVNSYETFGIPLPLEISNPYQVGLQRAVTGQTSVPEGPLKWAAGVVRNWLRALSAEYSKLGVEIAFHPSVTAPYYYEVTVNGVPPTAEEQARVLKLGKKLKLPSPPNITQICQIVLANVGYIPGEELYDFATMLEGQLQQETWDNLKVQFPYLDVDKASN
jgi:hypothetical protein